MTTLLSVNQIIDRATCSRSHLHNLRKTGKFPPAVRIGKRGVRFHASEVERWMNDPEGYTPPESTQTN